MQGKGAVVEGWRSGPDGTGVMRQQGLRLWKVPMLWREADVARVVEDALAARGRVAAVHVRMLRKLRGQKQVKDAGGAVGGHGKKVHCAAAVSLRTDLTFPARFLFRSGGSCFSAEPARSPVHPEPSTPAAPVKTLFCTAYTASPLPVPLPRLLAILRAQLGTAGRLVENACLVAERCAGLATAVQGVCFHEYMLECASEDAAGAVKLLLHDAETGLNDGTSYLHTAEYTVSGPANAPCYKPLFVESSAGAQSALAAENRHLNRRLVAEFLHPAVVGPPAAPVAAGAGGSQSILPYTELLIQKAAELACRILGSDDYKVAAITGAVACAVVLEHA